jgi:hypothetical protein
VPRALFKLTLLAIALAAFAWQAVHPWFSTVDTAALLHGVGAADRCLHAGVWSDCNSAGLGDVSHFALLEYLPALVMKRLGASLNHAYRDLCWLNSLAFLALLGLMWLSGRRAAGRSVGALLLLAGATSPLLWYSHSGFGEPLAALAAGVFAAGLTLRWPSPVTAAGLFFAVLAKEPIVPVLALIGAGVIAGRPQPGRVSRSELAALGVAAVTALALAAGFNVFRYGEPTNAFYLHDAVHPPLLDRISAFFGMLVAPNAGLVWFWPAAVIVAVLACSGASRSQRRALAALGLAFLLLVSGLASFWGPFGWEAWGPRLLLPWVPAFLIALVGVGRESLAAALERVSLRRSLSAVVATVLLLGAIPQVAAFRHWSTAFDLFAPGSSCPYHLPEIREYRAVFGNTTGYYRCLRRQAWTHPPVLLHTVDELDPLGLVWLAIAAGCIGALGTGAGLVERPRLQREPSSA